MLLYDMQHQHVSFKTRNILTSIHLRLFSLSLSLFISSFHSFSFSFLIFFVSLFHFQACVILNTSIYVCLCVCSVSICVQLLPHVFEKKVMCWGLCPLTLKLTVLSNIEYHHPHHSRFHPKSSMFLFFVSARHPIDTFAIQQKKVFLL